LRQLASRITARYHLLPLTFAEMRKYIQHRMRIAGSITPVFTPEAVNQIYRATKGIPRQINIVCDRALLGAYAKGLHQVTPDIVDIAVAETVGSAVFEPSPESFIRRIRGIPLVWVEISVAVLALVIMVLLLLGMLNGRPRLTVPVASAPAPAAVSVPAPAAVSTPAPASGAAKPIATNTATTQADMPLSGSAALTQLRRSAQPLPALTAALIRIWDPLAQLPPGENVCRALTHVSLGCYRGNGDWSELTALNHPALLTLNLGNNERFYVLLRQLGDDTAVLEGADGPHRYRLSQIDGLWTGEFFMLWYRPIDVSEVNMKSRGLPVQWVRRQLKEAGDQTLPTGVGQYDDALVNAVGRFQESRGLLVDGIVGTRTLIALADLSAPPTVPTLTNQPISRPIMRQADQGRTDGDLPVGSDPSQFANGVPMNGLSISPNGEQP
jgi:general secretion pathway protein A